ncbi:transcriptional regulator, DeoR family [Raineyella antarctica]|uniref:Lactose phosphotransferase system repressor n=1 Tax=Raineyella antarctica TaxID=1577474 RepID=A0A1G6GH54_9ACTN|nr:DeoR/GlpR family DNA-binding transcription regulator [Raineyella antarctica]SDB81085.1 transcriptional regulator, DeoR family [Raineyella antarctica]
MYAEERRAAIVDAARNAGRVRVADLAEQFAVAPETIRRDLDVLEGEGALRRVHGGAIPLDGFEAHEAALPDREVENAEAKRAIAAAALTYVPASDGTIVLDAGSTTGALASALVQQPRAYSGLSVVTNSVPAALALTAVEQHTVLMLGGTVRAVTQATVGPTTLELLGRVRVDVVFLGTNGISAGFGLTTPDAAEAAVKRGMVAVARRRVVLADQTKFGHDFFIRFAALKDLDVLITDAKPTGSLASALSDNDIEVVVA